MFLKLSSVPFLIRAVILIIIFEAVFSFNPKLNRLKSARLTQEFIPSTLPTEVETESTTLSEHSSPVPSDQISLENDKINSSNQTNPVIDQSELIGNAENRFRWVDFKRPLSYSPRLPSNGGLSSGFRNPLVTQPSPTSTILSTQATIQALSSSHYLGAQNQFDLDSRPVGNQVEFTGSLGQIDNVDNDPFFNLPYPNSRQTRVEHIVAECSDEFMKVVVNFNGTFNGIIYSFGYVHDPNCIYVNGSGRYQYEFYIRLNQCGTLGRQEMYHPTMPGEARRRDRLMWNTLSIQYNAMIEEEFDEHFRLTCEYGSDFWKTISFPSVNVETNTGAPVVFSITPPQCLMEIRKGFGVAGTRTSGPVAVGDALTLLIHMKSEKVGFDILVKNCIAHNGAQKRMQLIDSNGCVTNDKLISPFRGTNSSENGHQVVLYAYLKAFRFTGSLALYLECDIHMCHNRCPPQRCYWRNLSKRSTESQIYDEAFNSTEELSESISLSQALEVHHDQDEEMSESNGQVKNEDNLICIKNSGLVFVSILMVLLMMLSLGTSICYCHRMRKLKYIQKQTKSALNYQNRSYSPSHHDYSSSVKSSSSFSETNSIQFPYRTRFFRFY